MGQFVITPEWVGTFETAQRTLIQSAWDRVLKNLVWDKFMEVRPSTTLRELYFWLIETAQIRDEGENGAQKSFDSLAATFQEITNKDSGSALKLTRNEIEDNMMMRPGMTQGGPTLDYAANWARQIGGSSAYWPQKKMFELLAAGEGSTLGTAYDGKAFYATDHPVNPFDSAAGVYSTLFTTDCAIHDEDTGPNGVTLAQAIKNFRSVMARIRLRRAPNGGPRMLRIKRVLAGPHLEGRISDILDAKFYGSDGSTDNTMVKHKIEPEIVDELDSPTEFHVFCEEVTAEGAALVFQDRAPYVMTSYTPETQAQLQLRKQFMWSYDGRNAPAYGHPYLAAKCKPTL